MKRIFLFAAAAALLAALPAREARAQASQFHPFTPCRLIDTRFDEGPILQAGQARSFTIRGKCGIPTDATAISYNLTVVTPTDAGFLTLYPTGTSRPTVSSLNFPPGAVVGNGGVVKLGTVANPGTDPDLNIWLALARGTGTAHAVLDATGYFK